MLIHRSNAPARRAAGRLLLAALVAAGAACASGGAGATGARVAAERGIYRPDVAHARPLTRAERSRFTETSTSADVRAFVDSLAALGSSRVVVGEFGTSGQGRVIPYVIASRPLVRTPAEARRLNRPIVYVQGGIHGGEVEGKEALLALLRDLAFEDYTNVLDSIVLIAVPMYNPDGGDALGPQERNRTEQNGPAQVGRRPNGDTLDLNRDYVKAEAPETQATLRFLAAWDPDVFVDLHTTNGSYHGYALTYSPPLNPSAVFTQAWVGDTLLPALRQRLRLKHRIESFPYGNFVSQDSVERGWFTYDHRPRFGTNYMGLRGRQGILFEGYSHDPYPKRVASAYTFLYELLSLVGDWREEVVDQSREADRRATGWGTQPDRAPTFTLRAALRTPSRREAVLVEALERTGDSVRTEPGLAPGLRRGRVRPVVMPIYDRFTPTARRTMPFGYVIPASETRAIALMRRHGLTLEQLPGPMTLAVERFTIDSVVRAPRRFEKHETVRLEGRWTTAREPLPAGTVLVRSGQPLAILAMYLLDPETDDGLVTWNVIDAALRVGGTYPVTRLAQPVLEPLTVLDR